MGKTYRSNDERLKFAKKSNKNKKQMKRFEEE